MTSRSCAPITRGAVVSGDEDRSIVTYGVRNVKADVESDRLSITPWESRFSWSSAIGR